MTQYAIIQKLTRPGRAEVEVLRGTACGDSCGSCEVCKYASKIRVEVINEVSAQVGDRVEIETKTADIISAAILVYIMPFILFFAGYFISSRMGSSEGVSVLVSFAAFAAGMLIAMAVSRRRKKNAITYTITKIIEHGEAL